MCKTQTLISKGLQCSTGAHGPTETLAQMGPFKQVALDSTIMVKHLPVQSQDPLQPRTKTGLTKGGLYSHEGSSRVVVGDLLS